MRTLVLNANYEFLGFCGWQEAICHKVTGKVVVEEEYDREVHSPSVTMKVPAVIRLKKFIKVAYERLTYVSYNKRNVFLRDNYHCQYCNIKVVKPTVDHVIPVSRGGLSNWVNTVTACESCNDYKENKTPEEAKMKLLRTPSKPRGFVTIIRIKIGEIHTLWKPYLLVE